MAIRLKCTVWCIWLASMTLVVEELLVSVAMAQPPQIASVNEGTQSYEMLMVFGEGFEDDKTEVVLWRPPSDEKVIEASAMQLGKPTPPLPKEPPKDADGFL